MLKSTLLPNRRLGPAISALPPSQIHRLFSHWHPPNLALKSNIMLRAIGYWMESVHDTRFPTPQELVGTMSLADRTALANYLQKGKTFEQYRGYSWCRFSCGIDTEQMGSRDLTDGSWVWPQGLHHYVSAHGILLPEEFVRHALSSPTTKEFDNTSEPDFSFWMEWSSTRRSPAILKQLQETWYNAKVSAQQDICEHIAAEIKKYGLSNSRCIMANCTNKALNHQKFCAEHSLSLYGHK